MLKFILFYTYTHVNDSTVGKKIRCLNVRRRTIIILIRWYIFPGKFYYGNFFVLYRKNYGRTRYISVVRIPLQQLLQPSRRLSYARFSLSSDPSPRTVRASRRFGLRARARAYRRIFFSFFFFFFFSRHNIWNLVARLFLRATCCTRGGRRPAAGGDARTSSSERGIIRTDTYVDHPRAVIKSNVNNIVELKNGRATTTRTDGRNGVR